MVRGRNTVQTPSGDDRLVILRESDFKAYVGTLTERDVEGFLDYLRSNPPYH